MLNQRLVVSWTVMLCSHRSRRPFTRSAFSSHSLRPSCSSHAAMCCVHASTRHYSSPSSVVRHASTISSGISDAPTSAAPWERLVHLVTGWPSPEERIFSLESTDAPALASAADVSAALPAIRELWLSTYHPAFCCGEGCNGHDASALAASDVGAQKEHHRLLPEEADSLPLLVQTLGRIAAALQSWIVQTTETSAAMTAFGQEGGSLRLEDLHVWLAEVQALLLFIGRHHLRFLMPAAFASKLLSLDALRMTEKPTVHRSADPSKSSAARNSEAEKPRDAPAHADWPSGNGEHEALVSHASGGPPAAINTKNSGPATLRRLSRRKEERILHMVPPLPAEELLRVVVLVEAARTILDVARPCALASGVRAEVYSVLLSVVCVSEQLTSATLASLTTCLARCVDSYATSQQLSAVTRPSREPEAMLGEHGLSDDVRTLPSFLRCVSFNAGECGERASLLVLPSPIERQEAAQLERLRGGLSTHLRPTAVLHHFRVLANVMQHRLAETLYDAETGRGIHEAHRETERSVNRDAAFLTHATGAARVAKETRVESGLLGLLTLEQRKASSATTSGGTESTALSRPRRRRHTVAEIRSAADGGHVGEGNSSLGGNADGDFSHVSHNRAPLPRPTSSDSLENMVANHRECNAAANTARVYFTDLAEVCSAMAAIGFHGDGTAAEEPMWRHAVEFACSEIVATADARDAADAAVCAGDGDAAVLAANREVVIHQVLQDARDVCFALDRVGYLSGYDLIMETLVRCGFLCEAIPAPSAGRRSMKRIPSLV
ncbi:hypothetical protein JKF63_04142 [Porcisia hertigi]|uniref:Uncharacterized protein n=1 Tax=Porcisia hertigi TaxID=2761500 RepID=A0A836IB43_9TRYP|nr:hypothetical protein JKF63_04142 [Porcisia hertigi]